MVGSVQADQDTSFQAMNGVLEKMITIVNADPAVEQVQDSQAAGAEALHQHGADVYFAEATERAQGYGDA